MAYEVITTTDKAKRDALFQDLKRNGNHMERQVVKFSGVQEETIELFGKPWKAYKSSWSVAYPVTPDMKPTRRARLRREAEKRTA
jgi:hypothetical protein